MYRGYKIVPFIPAGRKKTLDVLFKYLNMNKGIVDHVQVWVNTLNQEDVDYIKSVSNDFLRPVYYEFPEAYIPHPIQYNTGKWYRGTTDPETIYIRFDDDIIYIEEDFFKNLLDFRIDHPEYFLVFPNIWNNAIISYIHQQAGRLDRNHGIVESPYCMDMVGWGSAGFAEYIHRVLLEKIKNGTQKELFFDTYLLENQKRFSISSFAFFGKDFAKFKGEIGHIDEETWLTEIYPKEQGLLNIVYGGALVSHYTFSPHQKPHLVTTDIFDQYKQIAEDKLSANYYNLLEKQS